MRRLVVVAMLALAVYVGSDAVVVSPAAEYVITNRVNELRIAWGVPPLATDPELANWARWWAWYMAEHDYFAHSDIGVLLDPWWIVGENVGTGAEPTAIFYAFTESPAHLRNMVDGRFSALGVGAYWDGWRLWVVLIFGG
jgi:uncharacterized protein YkwD